MAAHREALVLALLVAAAAAVGSSGGGGGLPEGGTGGRPPCVYTKHAHLTFLGPNNVLECRDGEGAEACQARCSADYVCAGYGLYLNGSRKGRCCTKSSSTSPSLWPDGASFVKANASCSRRLPGPAWTSMMFNCSDTLPYTHQGMLSLLPDGSLVGAMQAGASEGAPDQRIFLSRSLDLGKTWAPVWVPFPRQDVVQWSPLTYAAQDGTLFLWFSEFTPARGEMLVLQVTSSDGARTWGQPRAVLSSAAVGSPRDVWVLNKLVEVPGGAWLLPCDTYEPSRAFFLISRDRGQTWSAHGDIRLPGFPESGVALANASSLVAIIRGPSVGLYQSWSHDGGLSWTNATPTALPGASSKPCLWPYSGAGAAARPDGSGQSGILLTYNVRTRLQLSVAWSPDGVAWRDVAMLEDGSSGVASCYPTTISFNRTVLTAYTVYGRTHARRTGIRVAALDLDLSPL